MKIIQYITTAIFFCLTLRGASLNAEYSLEQSNPLTIEIKVMGNCAVCEKTIEKAVQAKGVDKADWNLETKVLTVTFNSKKITPEEILKKIAYAGYDNEKYLAPDEAYAALEDCCKYPRVKYSNASQSEHKHQTTNTEEHSKHQQQKNELENVYSLYFELKDALVAEDSKIAATKSKEFLNAIEDVKMEALGKKEHEAFMKYFSDLKTDAGHIAGTKDIEHQRDHFTSLSDKLFALMKVIKPSYTVYLDNCTMYNDGKGANWISKDSEIKNPYYGTKMPTCGKIKETLK